MNANTTERVQKANVPKRDIGTGNHDPFPLLQSKLSAVSSWPRTCCYEPCMEHKKIPQAITGALALVFSVSSPVQSWAQADNMKVNKRDKNPDQATADQQKMNATDQDLAAKIRKSVVADKSLSTYAHNVKIISQDGTVTLKGAVRSEAEAEAIVAKAVEVVGSPDKVINQMSVKPPKA